MSIFHTEKGKVEEDSEYIVDNGGMRIAESRTNLYIDEEICIDPDYEPDIKVYTDHYSWKEIKDSVKNSKKTLSRTN